MDIYEAEKIIAWSKAKVANGKELTKEEFEDYQMARQAIKPNSNYFNNNKNQTDSGYKGNNPHGFYD